MVIPDICNAGLTSEDSIFQEASNTSYI